MARDPIPTHWFALVVVRRDSRFLVVHERKHGQTWYLPAGRAEPGESLAEAAMRETFEETGVPIVLEGILRIEHSPGPVTRCRVIFLARPADDTPPRATEDSLGAAWVTLSDLDSLPLRGPELRDLFTWAQSDAPVYPLSLITIEGSPYRHANDIR